MRGYINRYNSFVSQLRQQYEHISKFGDIDSPKSKCRERLNGLLERNAIGQTSMFAQRQRYQPTVTGTIARRR